MFYFIHSTPHIIMILPTLGVLLVFYDLNCQNFCILSCFQGNFVTKISVIVKFTKIDRENLEQLSYIIHVRIL